jgi:hypothetical protein
MTRPSTTTAQDLEDILAALDPTGDLKRNDRPRTLAALGGLLGVDASTVFRWGKRGTSLDGGRVRLSMIRVGGRWMVRPSALAAYLARLNDAGAAGQNAKGAAGTAHRDDPQAAADERELDRLRL